MDSTYNPYTFANANNGSSSYNPYGNSSPYGYRTNPSPYGNLFAPQQQPQPQQNGSVIGSMLGDAQTGAGLAKTVGGLSKLGGGSGTTLGGLLGPGLGQAGGSFMGDIIPGVGTAAGIYGMLQNKGGLSNVLSGAGTGASIGSMFAPGIGTLIGGGIGALAGGVEDLFNLGKPSQTELQGRSAQQGAVNTMVNSGQATPAEQQEAQNAVKTGPWKDPNQALTLIMTRDALINKGVAPQDAISQSNQMVGNMYKAENSGGQAVAQAFSPIQQLLAGNQPAPASGPQTPSNGNYISSITPSLNVPGSPTYVPNQSPNFHW